MSNSLMRSQNLNDSISDTSTVNVLSFGPFGPAQLISNARWHLVQGYVVQCSPQQLANVQNISVENGVLVGKYKCMKVSSNNKLQHSLAQQEPLNPSNNVAFLSRNAQVTRKTFRPTTGDQTITQTFALKPTVRVQHIKPIGAPTAVKNTGLSLGRMRRSASATGNILFMDHSSPSLSGRPRAQTMQSTGIFPQHVSSLNNDSEVRVNGASNKMQQPQQTYSSSFSGNTLNQKHDDRMQDSEYPTASTAAIRTSSLLSLPLSSSVSSPLIHVSNYKHGDSFTDTQNRSRIVQVPSNSSGLTLNEHSKNSLQNNKSSLLFNDDALKNEDTTHLNTKEDYFVTKETMSSPVSEAVSTTVATIIDVAGNTETTQARTARIRREQAENMRKVNEIAQAMKKYTQE